MYKIINNSSLTVEKNWLNRAYRILAKSNSKFNEKELNIILKTDSSANLTKFLSDLDFRFELDDKNRWQAIPTQTWLANCPLTELDAVVVDIESTGSIIGADKIFEIGAYKIKGFEVVDEFHSHVNPGRKIPGFIANLTRVDISQVDAAPKIDVVLPEFMKFLGNSIFVAHNAEFDFNFIMQEAFNINYPALPIIDLCSWLVAQHVLQGKASKFGIMELAEFHGQDIKNHHSAKSDSKMTTYLLIYILKALCQSGIDDLYGLLEIDKKMFQKNYNPRKRLKRP